jgi:hypothetical protein
MKWIASPGAQLTGLLMLASCMQPENPSLGPDARDEAVGEAEIHLPSLPPGFLGKAAAHAETDTLMGPLPATFILTLSGGGMEPRRESWPMGDSSLGPIKVADIPVGLRLFKGELAVGGAVAYVDSVWAMVEAGRTVAVHLRLRQTSGSATVCVEIEGLPLPAGCAPVRRIPDVSGCWNFLLPSPDSGQAAVLSILQRDSLLEGVIRWPDGITDTSRGFVNSDRYVNFQTSLSPWGFGGQIDSLGRTLSGRILRMRQPAFSTSITAHKGTCGGDTVRIDSSFTCWDVSQHLDGRGTSGRLSLRDIAGTLQGFFQWDCCTGMPLQGIGRAVNGNYGLYLYGSLPAGLSLSPMDAPDSVHYKGQVAPGGYIEFGTVNGMDSTGAMAQRGEWKGVRSACRPQELEVLRAAHRL